jgi:hypothetical protein
MIRQLLGVYIYIHTHIRANLFRIPSVHHDVVALRGEKGRERRRGAFWDSWSGMELIIEQAT